MTSKFASRIVCSPNPNRSELEYGGVSVKGGCGKIRWDNVKQGDKWVNAFYPEDEPLSSNCSANGANIEPSSDYHINEHSEVDWLSKVIAHQEHIYNDRSNNWSDMNHGKADLTKEEHDMDIISTLTAVAALLRDWCVLETDLSPMGADKHADKPTTVDTVYCNEWVWSKDDMDWQNNVSSMKKDALIQSEIFSMSHHDVAWGTFIQRHLEAQKMLYPSLFWSGSVAKIESGKMFPSDLADTKHDSFGFTKHTNHSWNSDGMAKKGLLFKPSYNRLSQLHIMCAEKEFQEAVTTSDSVEHDHTLLDIGSHIPCTHGPLHHTASRYNFGCEDDFRFDSDLGQLASVSADASELPEDCLMYGKGCRFMEVDINDHLSGLQYRELHDGGFNTPAISEHLVSTYGATDDVELDKKVNAIALVHEAMPFVFSYLSLQDLLTMEKVCKSFKDWIRNDVLLWQNLHIEPPLSKNLTDDVFIKLTSRCRGQLRCLNLVECTKLTEGAVEQVVLSNPRITKLSLPGCTRISADSVVRMVEILAHEGQPGLSGLKQLRVRNIYGITKEHLAKLKDMVGARSSYQKKPQYYHNGHRASFCDDDRPIDVEECPKCSNVRLVYDCTREKCQQSQGLKFQNCRACFLCTVRCEECGRCINDNDFEETFSLDLLCSCCWLRLPKCAACSRPGCGRHADHFIRTPDRTFFCGNCAGIPSDERGPEFHVHT